MKPRPSNITVCVTRTTTPIDFDAWAESYVRAYLEAVRERRQAEAA